MVKRHQKPAGKRANRLIILIIGGVCALVWADVVQDGKLTKRWQEKKKKELEQLENCETYELIARSDGWYTCYLCPTGKYYLYAGEQWKVGTTCAKPRHSETFLKAENVQYIVIEEGDYATCRQLEIELISSFPLSEQNMKRAEKDRLIVPPGHKRYNFR